MFGTLPRNPGLHFRPVALTKIFAKAKTGSAQLCPWPNARLLQTAIDLCDTPQTPNSSIGIFLGVFATKCTLRQGYVTRQAHLFSCVIFGVASLPELD